MSDAAVKAKAGHAVSPALMRALRFPEIPTPATMDIGHDIRMARPCQCPQCGWQAKVLAFARSEDDRQGYRVIACECPDCATIWKRIEV